MREGAGCEDEDEIALCLKHSSKSGKEYHYHQYCKSAADIEDLGPGDFLSKDKEIAACGCCLHHDFIVEDLRNSDMELKGKRPKRSKRSKRRDGSACPLELDELDEILI
jgi:hypothetical protein